MIVPWAPGGGTDTVGRAIASALSADLGVPVPVVNRPGGSGTVGHMQIRDAQPDGYTVGFVVPQLLTGPILGQVPITWREVQPVALLNADPGAVTVGAGKPWRTLRELVDHARRHPGTVRVGNSGQGGTWHMLALELERKAGIELIHVPYAGAAPALQDLVGGHIDAVTFSAPEARAPVMGGQARMIAVAAPQRLPDYPGVPTAAEQGINAELSTWRGLATSKGTPVEILGKLEAAVRKAMNSTEFKAVMEKQGFGIRFLNSADFERFLREQDARYRTYFAT
jgi:tripartite-type tricarboxylate transporter receptor subunit TctC